MDSWQASHENWWAADHLRLQKLNRARGFSNEGLSLSDDDPLVKNVPLEFRAMLPIAISAEDVTANPAGDFFAKCHLDSMLGSSPAPSESDLTDWLAKLLAAVPTHHDGDGGLLRKRTDLQIQCEKLIKQVREFCVGDEEERLEKGLKCMDFGLITEMVDIIIKRVKAERALAA